MQTQKASHRNPIALLSLLCLASVLIALSSLPNWETVVSAKGQRLNPTVVATSSGFDSSASNLSRQTRTVGAQDRSQTGIKGRGKEELSNCDKNTQPYSLLSHSGNLNSLFLYRPRLEHPNGWVYPAGIGPNYCDYCTWHCQNPNYPGKYHLAQDMCNPQGDPVYAIDYGEVIHSQCVGDYGNNGACGGAVSIQHRAKDGTWFTALYGHLSNYLPVGARVYAGDIIGYSNNYNPPHVHFGVRLGVNPDPANWFVGYTTSLSNNLGFTNPETFLSAYQPCKKGSSVNFRPNNSAPVHPNGTLIKSVADSTGTVYVIRNGQKQGIVSPEVLRNLYANGGFDFKDVITVAQDEFERYPTGPAISSQQSSNGRTHAEGRLIKRNPGGEIAIVSDGMRRPFVSAEVFLGLGYLFCNVADATDTNYDSYPAGAPVTGSSTTTSCNYSISPASRTIASSGGTGSTSVSVASGCSWTAGSNASWLTITSGNSGNGNGTVSYSVTQNSGQQRSGTITVSGGGQNFTHTVTQDGSTATNQNPTEQAISNYADQLSSTYKVPSVVIKALLEQESGWRQFDGSGNTVINNEPDGRIGIGLTQVTVQNTSTVALSLGVIQEGATQGSNSFTTTTQSVSVDVNRLKTEWQYNMEIGIRVLVAKKVASAGAEDDASILENWYYPLAYYNGAVKGGANDPNNPTYSRSASTGSDWKSTSRFPYQECVFNIIAQLYPIPASRSSYYGPAIKVTLPGPSAVATGAGQYGYVESAFCFYDWAQYFSDGTVRMGNWGNQNNGCIPIAKTRTGIVVHKVQFGAPTSSQPSPPTVVSPGTGSAPGATISTTTPTFQWSGSSGATRYGLYLSKSPYGASNIVYNNTALTGTSFTLPSGYLVNGENYRWNMTAFNSAGESGVSNTLYFNVSSVPADNTGPTLSITSHSNGQTVTTDTITLSGTASDTSRGDSGVLSVTVNGVRANNDTATGSGTANWSRTITLGQGANGITVVATDNSLNQNSTTQSMTVNYPPTLGPPNDAFANAQIISGNSGSVNGNNAGATKEAGEPNHAGIGGGPSVWWRWQSPTSGAALINTTGSNFDTLLAVYTGPNVSALTVVASNDDDPTLGGLQSVVTFNATAGTEYFIAVDGYNSATGNITLNWNLGSPPNTTLTINSVNLPAGRASGGQQIRLTGAFANLSTVRVGDATATWSYTNGSSDTSVITVTTPPHAVGAVAIDLVSVSGSTYSKPNAFAYLTTVFTDDTLLAGVTQVKAQHIVELRQSVDALRTVAGLTPASWNEPLLLNFVTPIKTAHIMELRAYLEDAAGRLGYPATSYTEPTLGVGSAIKRVHIEELRQRVKALAGELPRFLL